jgi:hypothetical protein
MVTLPPWLVSTNFGTCSYQCFVSNCTPLSLHMLKCSCAHTLSYLFMYCSFVSFGHTDIMWSIVSSNCWWSLLLLLLSSSPSSSSSSSSQMTAVYSCCIKVVHLRMKCLSLLCNDVNFCCTWRNANRTVTVLLILNYVCWASCYQHENKVLLKFTATYKRLSVSVVRDSD